MQITEAEGILHVSEIVWTCKFIGLAPDQGVCLSIEESDE